MPDPHGAHAPVPEPARVPDRPSESTRTPGEYLAAEIAALDAMRPLPAPEAPEAPRSTPRPGTD